jgi:predicted flap endonuclease-1-like 5' DNA nuclease
MASVIHIAEVAAILAAAYVLGWVIGYVAHRLVARAPVVATVPAERIAAATGAPAADALVKAPVIEPVPSSPPPPVIATPVEPPALPLAAADSEPPPAEQPEPSAVTELVVPPEPPPSALPPVAIAELPPPPPLRVEPVPTHPAPVDPEPERPVPEPEVIITAMPASRPGEAWNGEIRGRVSPVIVLPEAAPVAMAAEEPAPQQIEPPPVEMPLVIDLGPLGPDSTYGEPMVPEVVAPLVAETAPALDPPPTVPEPAPARPLDEDAAMRAIEGGWSRVHARALAGAPELSDVGAAVAAAQSAVEQVLAKAGIDEETSGQAARPKGLPRARGGRKDDLKRISGLGALDESTLNNLGVFHFDQIAGWNEAQVLWMENHVFARGRIGREGWQQQARDLVTAVNG